MTNSSERKRKKKARSSKPVSCFNYALRLLSRRDYSVKELEQKLRKKYNEEEIKNTIDKLTERELLNEKLYAERLIKKYAFEKKYGYLKIRYLLIGKGIKSEIFESLLSAIYDEEKERENALSLSIKRPLDKLAGFLLSRGYRDFTVRKVLAELKDRR